MIYRILFALIAGIAAAYSLHALHKREITPVQILPGFREGKDVRNRSLFADDFHGKLAAVFMLSILLFNKSRMTGIRLIWSIMMELLVLISLYCVLLLILLPMLRRIISSRACGRLWELPILLAGSVLYLESVELSWWSRLPKLIIYIPKAVIIGFTTVWLIGFTVALLWYIIGHFRFKKQLKAGSLSPNKQMLRIWREELAKIGLDQTTPLLIQPAIQTPLMIGVRKAALTAYLPDRSYTEAELRLIFQHELRHAFRRDAEIKMAWAVIRSALWFNPLVWIATQKAAEDLELSCDSFVLREADENTRKRYAELLLDAAGDGRGFSTCLSSKAKTLCYRLKCVLRPAKRLSGGFMLAVVVFAMIMSSGTISFAHDQGKLCEFYDFSCYTDITNSFSRIITGNSIGFVGTYGESYFSKRDDQLLIDYFSSLEVLALTKPFESVNFSAGEGGIFGDGQWAGFALHDPQNDAVVWIHLWEDWLVVETYSNRTTQYYKVPDGIDWNWLNTMLVFV